jgi:hypothetical protein
LQLFGSFQDAMTPNEWSLYHFLNLKMISPQEVIDKAIQEWNKRPNEIEYNQLEGFVTTNNGLARIHEDLLAEDARICQYEFFLTIKKSCQIGSGQARLK